MYGSLSRRQLLQIGAVSTCASTCSGLLSRLAIADEADTWKWLDNGVFRIGVNLSAGASIGHFSYSEKSAQADKRNVLNHFDRGRFLQQSYYGDVDGSDWNGKPWRYNPVQGGEWRGESSRLEEQETEGETFVSRVTPRNWAGGELLPECSMTQRITLKHNHVHLQINFLYTGTKSHAARHQEIPAMFVRSDLTQMVWYEGDAPWTNAPLQRRVPGWPNESAKLSENWVAYIGPDENGVGLFVPVSNEATCYRYQAPEDAGCSYVAPLTNFALKPNLEWQYEAFLTLGKPDEMRSVFSDLHKQS